MMKKMFSVITHWFLISLPFCGHCNIRWQKYWSFSFSIIPSKEHPGLISFRMDWLDLLTAQDTLKSLLQHHSSKASILQHSAFFTVQLSHPYMTSGKTIALTRRNFLRGHKDIMTDFLCGPVLRTACLLLLHYRSCGFDLWSRKSDPTCRGVWPEL